MHNLPNSYRVVIASDFSKNSRPAVNVKELERSRSDPAGEMLTGPVGEDFERMVCKRSVGNRPGVGLSAPFHHHGIRGSATDPWVPDQFKPNMHSRDRMRCNLKTMPPRGFCLKWFCNSATYIKARHASESAIHSLWSSCSGL